MMQGHTLQTVDPRYRSVLTMMGFLQRLGVIEIGQSMHKFSHGLTLLPNAIKTKPHWIPMAVVSLSVEYMELIPLGVKHAKEDT